MPNWVQLVEFTSEFTPGDWREAVAFVGDRGPLGTADVVAVVGDVRTAVASCLDVDDAIGRGLRRAAHEREVVANARLIADAPRMLVTLASVLNAYDMAERFPSVARQLIASHSELIGKLMLRHVKIGCAPVDAENREDAPKECTDSGIARLVAMLKE